MIQSYCLLLLVLHCYTNYSYCFAVAHNTLPHSIELFFAVACTVVALLLHSCSHSIALVICQFMIYLASQYSATYLWPHYVRCVRRKKFGMDYKHTICNSCNTSMRFVSDL